MPVKPLVPPAVRPVLKFVRDRLPRPTREGRVLCAWRLLAGPAGRYPPASRMGNQGWVDPFVHRCRVGGVPTELLIVSGEGLHWYSDPDLYDTEYDLFTRLRLVRPGDVVFDLGANQGVSAIALARLVGPTGKVYAFDPFPMNADLIRLNGRLNGIRNIEVVKVGLSDRPGTVAASGQVQCLAVADTPDLVPVRLDVLDHYAYLRPSFMKVDIEGAEVSALAAAGQVLAGRPNLYLEMHRDKIPLFGRRPEELADLLPTAGYATAALWTPADGLRPLTRDGLAARLGNHGHVVLGRD